jgi:hypothetical protein
MRSSRNLIVIVASLASAGLVGCISTTREIHEPAPVVQLTPPAPVVAPVYPPSSTSESTTTSWGHGAVIQRQTTTSDDNGAVEKQTSTTWDNGSGVPSQTTVTTTTSGSTVN